MTPSEARFRSHLITPRTMIESKTMRPSKFPIFMFDIGGVIIKWRNNDPIYRYLSKWYNRPYAEVKRVCVRRLPSLESGGISITTFMNETLHDLGRSLERRDSATRLWVLPLERLFKPKLGMINCVRTLRGNGYSVYALTNVSPPHLEFFRRTGLAGEFDHLFASSELGSVKPNREIFQKVFRYLDTSPTKVVFVDDRAENVKAARDYGIRWAFRFKSISQLKRDIGHVIRESEPRARAS
jgi:putative hydrolase of the HAD superfamily